MFAKQDAASRDPSRIRATFAGSRVELPRGFAFPIRRGLRETTSPPCSRERASRTMPAREELNRFLKDSLSGVFSRRTNALANRSDRFLGSLEQGWNICRLVREASRARARQVLP